MVEIHRLQGESECLGWLLEICGYSGAQGTPEIRILNPYFIQEAAFTLIGLPFNNGLMGRGNIPTLGSVAVTMALHGCDEVAVAGFGYDMSTPNAPCTTMRPCAWQPSESPGRTTFSERKNFCGNW